jgi:hypothetical protein
MSNPGPTHWSFLKHLLRYLSGTKKMGLRFSFNNEPPILKGYSDSSFADCPDTSRSTLAYCFLYGSAALSWYSKLNTYVTRRIHSTGLGRQGSRVVIATVFTATADSFKPLPIYVDNSGVVSIVFNPVEHQSNKHVRIGCHYTRELTEQKTIAPQKISTELNIADIFTKPLPLGPFRGFANTLISPESHTPILRREEHVFMLNANGGYGPVVKNEGWERMDRHDYYASDTSYDSDNSTQNAAIVRASDFAYDYVPPEIKAPDITLVCTTCGQQSTEQSHALQCRTAKCQTTR